MSDVTVQGGQEVVGVSRIEGPIVVVEGGVNVSYDEVVEIQDSKGLLRRGRVLEVGVGYAGVAFAQADVVDRDRRRRAVVIDDGAVGEAVGDRRAARVPDGDDEHLVALADRVAEHGDGDRARRLAGTERQRAAGARVIRAGRGAAVSRVVADRHVLGAGDGQSDGKVGVARAGIALADADVAE